GRVRQRGLRLLRSRGAPLHRLRRPPPAVPHLALLGLERAHPGSLGANLPSLPRERPRPALSARTDRATAEPVSLVDRLHRSAAARRTPVRPRRDRRSLPSRGLRLQRQEAHPMETVAAVVGAEEEPIIGRLPIV